MLTTTISAILTTIAAYALGWGLSKVSLLQE
jgi:hypothetical protein